MLYYRSGFCLWWDGKQASVKSLWLNRPKVWCVYRLQLLSQVMWKHKIGACSALSSVKVGTIHIFKTLLFHMKVLNLTRTLSKDGKRYSGSILSFCAATGSSVSVGKSKVGFYLVFLWYGRIVYWEKNIVAGNKTQTLKHLEHRHTVGSGNGPNQHINLYSQRLLDKQRGSFKIKVKSQIGIQSCHQQSNEFHIFSPL